MNEVDPDEGRDKLVDRLRETPADNEMPDYICNLCDEAADTIERLKARIEELERDPTTWGMG